VGTAWLHTDFNPLNVLISDQGTHIIDWAWPTRGAAFIDPACFVLRLLAAGHTPAEAESLAAWTSASTEAIDVLAKANRRMWEQIAQHDPQPWKTRMATVAGNWVQHRSSLFTRHTDRI
jgi:Ser/Thr protein kinase RdoA (MazF antagonist)